MEIKDTGLVKQALEAPFISAFLVVKDDVDNYWDVELSGMSGQDSDMFHKDCVVILNAVDFERMRNCLIDMQKILDAKVISL